MLVVDRNCTGYLGHGYANAPLFQAPRCRLRFSLSVASSHGRLGCFPAFPHATGKSLACSRPPKSAINPAMRVRLPPFFYAFFLHPWRTRLRLRRSSFNLNATTVQRRQVGPLLRPKTWRPGHQTNPSCHSSGLASLWQLSQASLLLVA